VDTRDTRASSRDAPAASRPTVSSVLAARDSPASFRPSGRHVITAAESLLPGGILSIATAGPFGRSSTAENVRSSTGTTRSVSNQPCVTRAHEGTGTVLEPGERHRDVAARDQSIERSRLAPPATDRPSRSPVSAASGALLPQSDREARSAASGGGRSGLPDGATSSS
jgi:hypothetical protein